MTNGTILQEQETGEVRAQAGDGHAVDAHEGAEGAGRACPNCGGPVAGRGRGTRKAFCEEACKRAFYARQKGEGAAVIGPLKAWMANRHAKRGTVEFEQMRAARREATSIIAELIREDREAGRPDLLSYISERLEESRWMDRRK